MIPEASRSWGTFSRLYRQEVAQPRLECPQPVPHVRVCMYVCMKEPKAVPWSDLGETQPVLRHSVSGRLGAGRKRSDRTENQ